MKTWLLLTALALAATGAQAQSKTYAPGAFDSLQLAGAAQVRYRQGERDEVLVEGDDSVQQRVSLEMRGSSLTVRTHGSCNGPSRACSCR
jgi:Putative auto-transporter adhesin, head GIN domain